ncbi:vinexin-like isoform X4 [Centruroides vittatus]|uniref:vinexin-like isoform X4 n=1 Tax=Centruroides vittatus TaxID=120091 RepID=UPI003510BC6C
MTSLASRHLKKHAQSASPSRHRQLHLLGLCSKHKPQKQQLNVVWMPGQSASVRESENLSSPVKSENNCIFAQNENDVCQNVSVYENSENFNSKRYNGLSNMSDVGDMEKTGKTFPFNVDPSNVTYNIELTDKPPPKEAVIVDQKVTIKDGNIHQDTYYAMPYDKVTSTKTIIKAPTYEGIGPTEDGVPIGLRTSIKKEYGSDWYKTMFRSLHKCDSNEGLKFQSDGYMSDPELNRKDKSSSIKNKSKTLMTNKAKEKSLKEAEKPSYSFPAAKSSIQTYNHKPWIISDYEPGYSSIANNENSYINPRHLPPLITPQPKYVYNDGYDSDSTLVRKTGKQHTLDPQQQKQWYQNIQKGGEIPLPGLCKPAPQKPQEPVVGPPPPVPSNWDADSYYRIYAPKPDDSQRYTSPLHSPVQNVKRPESSKQKLQDDFLTKLDDVILNKCEDNIRQSSSKSPNGNSSLSLQNVPVSPNKVVILYDFIAQSSRELSLKKGDVVNIQRRIDKNWYEGKIDGKTGIFPVSYAEPVSSKSSQRLSKKYIKGWARAKFDFIAKNPVELTLYKDDMVSLIREVDSNWYEGNLNGKTGIFPISYVEVVSESEYSAKPSKPLMPSSTLSPERNGRNEVDINRNDIEDAEIINNEKVFPVNEVLPSRNTLTKFNFMESEYNNNRVSPYQALYAYKPQNDDELELKEGDVVYVVEKCDDGWFVGTSMRTGLFGTFPGNYIEKI